MNSPGKIWLGNESNKAAEQSVTGDVTISSAGVVLIGNGKINSDKILDGTIVNADISDTAGIVYSKLSIEDGDLTIAKTNGLQAQLNSIATSTTTLQANIDGKVSKAGDTMTGGLTFNNVTGSVIGASGSTAGINISTNLYVSAGNVGIGTTSPGAKLEVNGDAKIGTNLTVVANTTLGTNSSNSLTLNMGAVILNALNASNAKVDFKDSSSNTVVYFKKKP